MVIDSSAVIAILFAEPEAEAMARAIGNDPKRLMSSVNALESSIVIEAKSGEAGGREFDLLCHHSSIEIIPLTAEHYVLARSAWRRFGKGRHPAGLNMGDCCAYALARHSGEPLLYKGDDFGRTDIDHVRY